MTAGESAELRELKRRNRLLVWLTDITEHRTGEGKLYLCAVKDVYSGRIVGYSIAERMRPGSPSTRSPLQSPAAASKAPRLPAAWSIPIADRSSPGSSSPNSAVTT